MGMKPPTTNESEHCIDVTRRQDGRLSSVSLIFIDDRQRHLF